MNPGQTIADRYVIRNRLGRGGMGEVWAADDPVLGREVAIKICPLGDGGDEVALERFSREARAAARLSHPNVVAVHDGGVADGQAYLVMELLPGRSVQQLVAEQGPLPVDEAMALARDAAAGLAAAHSAGVVHRDVKPGNLVLDDTGRVKLVDFGIALLAEVTSGITATGTVVGSAPYLSPEQARGEPATPASDHYALGCVLMMVLTGSPPFAAEHPMGVLRRHLDDAPPRVAERRADVPADVDALVNGLLSKRPEDRASAAAALNKGVGSGHPPVGGPTAVAPGMSTALLPEPTQLLTSAQPQEAPRRAGVYVVGAVVFVALLAIVIWAIVGGDNDSGDGDKPIATSGDSSSADVGASEGQGVVEPTPDQMPETEAEAVTLDDAVDELAAAVAAADIAEPPSANDKGKGKNKGPGAGKSKDEDLANELQRVRDSLVEGRDKAVKALDDLERKAVELSDKDRIEAAAAQRIVDAIDGVRAAL